MWGDFAFALLERRETLDIIGGVWHNKMKA
jgi:hypothetical protein